jgi:hypothetical protein
MWINVFVSYSIPYSSEPPVGVDSAWSGTDFWECVLEPLVGWVR